MGNETEIKYVSYDALVDKVRTTLYELLDSKDEDTRLRAVQAFYQAAPEIRDPEEEYEEEEEGEDGE